MDIDVENTAICCNSCTPVRWVGRGGSAIGLTNPLAIQMLLPIAKTPIITNFFATIEHGGVIKASRAAISACACGDARS